MINARIEQGPIKSGIDELASLDRHLNPPRCLLMLETREESGSITCPSASILALGSI
jgi:hypothetical protein